MLTRLELVGFKSFADKTRFDFAPGITAIVGPNGSGKSNVVDAVRWILGEQSAKTLRGGEMADVIFNGSSSRKSLGMAEVTVAFDNTRRLLASDADEVQVTRRVYRDGTGEYVLNGQDARLKDIKDLFLGSGAGTNGYTIIAQGRVDELLAASNKDRREIFEEAAGISRFKAKKLETLRKLATVEANRVRSKDRLDALDQQLRTLKLQAAKAERFREYSDRLRELRVGLSTREYAELTETLAADGEALRGLKEEVSTATGRTADLERETADADREAAAADEALRAEEAGLADARERIAGHDATAKHERAAAENHDAELLRVGRQRADLGARVKALETDTAKATADAATAAERLQSATTEAAAADRELAAVGERLTAFERQEAADRERQMDVIGRVAAFQSQASSHAAQLERVEKLLARRRAEAEGVAGRRTALGEAVAALSRAGADVQARLKAARSRGAEGAAERATLLDVAEQLHATLGRLQVQRGDLRGRVDVLEGLERSFEGLGTGVRAVLAWLADARTRVPESSGGVAEFGDAPNSPALPLNLGAESANPYPWLPSGDAKRADAVNSGNARPADWVVGLVADLLTVPREVAPLIELALGDAAQRFVVRDPAAVDALVAALGPLPGRVGFVPVAEEPNPLTPFPGKEGGAGSDSSSPPVLGEGPGEGFFPTTADALVYSDVPTLAAQLLGDVVLADTLADARRLAAAFPGYRFVTRAGDLLEPDGSLTVGPPLAGAGLVSRKSELRDLRHQLAELEGQAAVVEADLGAVRQRLKAVEATLQAVEAEVGVLAGEAGDLQQQIARQQQQLEQLGEDVENLEAECDLLDRDRAAGAAALADSRDKATAAEREDADLRRRLAEATAAIRAAQDEQERRRQAHTDARVALSRATADRDRTRDRLAQLEAEARKRRIEAVDLSAAEANARGRRLAGELAMLRASAGTADAYREKEDRERRAADLHARRSAAKAARDRAAAELHALRSVWQARQAAAHARELAVRDLTNRRDALVQRLAEEYGIDLAGTPLGTRDSALGTASTPAAAQQEIDDLRKKLARLGSVNMEALDELTRVEAEATELHARHDDLVKAERALREIIDQINADSRTLFADTLNAVRGYFQELFRKLFAGGQADIVLEDPSDVLESGVEVTARPPGKELRSLSLLSGGEKTLTAVALLLAIFRNRPSPFCLLDEVDAALDEANTQRLAGVLSEYRSQSQFIVVTHKKRTMAAAEVLHGVTMQESGVSKQVAVRFEDWPDDEGEVAGRVAA